MNKLDEKYIEEKTEDFLNSLSEREYFFLQNLTPEDRLSLNLYYQSHTSLLKDELERKEEGKIISDILEKRRQLDKIIATICQNDNNLEKETYAWNTMLRKANEIFTEKPILDVKSENIENQKRHEGLPQRRLS